MQKYIDQLLDDLAQAKPTAMMYDVTFSNEEEGDEWLMDREDADLSPRKTLGEWTGIQPEQLPPARMLSDRQIHLLLHELIDLLQTYNLMVAFHTHVPERKLYHAIREHWEQEVPFLKFSMHYLDYCDHDQKNCPLGHEYCQCAFLEEHLSGSPDFEEEDFGDIDDDMPWKNDSSHHRGLECDDPDF